jgi:hypothetical protein
MSDLERPGKRGYSWPPFEPGNEIATLHGAKSPRRVDPVAQALAEWVTSLDGLDHLREPRFAPAVAAWARQEAVVLLLSDYCARLSIEQATVPQRKGASSSSLEILRQHEATAATMRARLGLDPMSAAKLQRELVEATATARYAGLDAVREQGRQARARRLRSIDAPPDDGGDAA